MKRAPACSLFFAVFVFASTAFADYGVKSIRISCSPKTDNVEIEPFIAWNDGNSRFLEFGADEAIKEPYMRNGNDSFYALKNIYTETHYSCRTNKRYVRIILKDRKLTVLENGSVVVNDLPIGNVWDFYGPIYFLRSNTKGQWQECHNKSPFDKDVIQCQVFEYPHNNSFRLIEVVQVDVARVRKLLSEGANPNSRDTDGTTPLIIASFRTDVEIVKLLIDSGADVNAQDRYNNTPLIQAVRGGSKEIISLLIEKGAAVNVPNKSILIEAISAFENLEIVKFLLDHGADVNGVSMVTNSSISPKSTPLMVAAERGYLDTVKLLLANKADVNIRNERGYTALKMARAPEIVKILRDYGATE